MYLLGDGAETGSLPESESESESRWSKREYDAHVGPVLSGCMGMVITAARASPLAQVSQVMNRGVFYALVAALGVGCLLSQVSHFSQLLDGALPHHAQDHLTEHPLRLHRSSPHTGHPSTQPTDGGLRGRLYAAATGWPYHSG